MIAPATVTRGRATRASDRPARVAQYAPTFRLPVDPVLTSTFQTGSLIAVYDVLPPGELRAMRAEAEAGVPRMTHSYLPGHKKGYTLSYEEIDRSAPRCLAFYHADAVHRWISSVVGVRVLVTPDKDQSSLSVLCYREAGDHINWHYDHNFYRGRHFTVLLVLASEARAGGLSACRLMRRDAAGGERDVAMPPNALVVFEGATVRHKATPTAEGDHRLILSMTYCSDPRTRRFHEFARRVKDTSFHGLRALWH